MAAPSSTPRLRHSQHPSSPTLRPGAPVTPLPSRSAWGPERVLTPAAIAPRPDAHVTPAGGPRAPASEAAADVEGGALPFEQCFGDDPVRIQRAKALKSQADRPVVPCTFSHQPVPEASLPPHLQPIDVAELLKVYREVVPSAGPMDPERALGVLEALVYARVQPQELRELVARGQARDLLRTIASAELTYAASFGAAGAMGLSLAEEPLVEAHAQGHSVAVAQDLNTAAGFLLAGGVIAVGSEVAQGVIREGKMGPRYTQPVVCETGRLVPFAESPQGQSVQRRSALPFGVLYGADQLLRYWIPTPPTLRLALGAGAAAVSAVYKFQAATRCGGHLDPTWLDATTKDKREAMFAAISDLRQGSWEASKGYCTDHLLPGLRAGAGEVLSAQGAARIAVRLAACSFARAGSALMAATGTVASLPARVCSDLWLSVTWGWASTWPQRVVSQPASGRVQPDVQQVAPPAKATAPR
ncbi:MAG: hypothetical protein RL522_1471 [Pseudomonadota bacterium]